MFFTAVGIRLPHFPVLVHLGYEPRQWFRDEKILFRTREFDDYARIGKIHFMIYDTWQPVFSALRNNQREDRVVIIVRPSMAPVPDRPDLMPPRRIHGPDGRPLLWIYEMRI